VEIPDVEARYPLIEEPIAHAAAGIRRLVET